MQFIPSSSLLAALACSAACLAATGTTQAAETYVSGGFPFVVVGVAQAFNSSFAVRADFGTIGRRSYSFTTDGDDFKGDVHYSREALLGDWFVASGGFRLTGGATINQAKATMRASTSSGHIRLNGVDYATPSALYYADSNISLPKVTPYIGIGWGHHEKKEPGITFNLDLGASIGKARASKLTASPALQSELAASPTGVADLSNENQQYQDEVGKVKAIPQLTVGLGYQF